MLCENLRVAGVPGFEPGMPIPKTGALPLGDTPSEGARYPLLARLAIPEIRSTETYEQSFAPND